MPKSELEHRIRDMSAHVMPPTPPTTSSLLGSFRPPRRRAVAHGQGGDAYAPPLLRAPRGGRSRPRRARPAFRQIYDPLPKVPNKWWLAPSSRPGLPPGPILGPRACFAAVRLDPATGASETKRSESSFVSFVSFPFCKATLGD